MSCKIVASTSDSATIPAGACAVLLAAAEAVGGGAVDASGGVVGAADVAGAELGVVVGAVHLAAAVGAAHPVTRIDMATGAINNVVKARFQVRWTTDMQRVYHDLRRLPHVVSHPGRADSHRGRWPAAFAQWQPFLAGGRRSWLRSGLPPSREVTHAVQS
jgi:hypothetical protein